MSKHKREDLTALAERKKQLEHDLQHNERQLYSLEGRYLESTGGVMVADAEHYVVAATAPPHAQKAMKKKQKPVQPEDRIFSLSSVTAFDANNKSDPAEMGVTPFADVNEVDPAPIYPTMSNKSTSSTKNHTSKRGRPPGSKSKSKVSKRR